MMQGACCVSSQYSSPAIIPLSQQESLPRPAASPEEEQPTPPHWMQSVGQHTMLFPSMPSSPLLHVETDFSGDARAKERGDETLTLSSKKVWKKSDSIRCAFLRRGASHGSLIRVVDPRMAKSPILLQRRYSSSALLWLREIVGDFALIERPSTLQANRTALLQAAEITQILTRLVFTGGRC